MNTAAKPKIAFGEGEMRRHVRQRHQRPHRHFAGGDAGRPVRRHMPPPGTLATIGCDQPVTLVACAFGGDQCHMPVILMDMGNVLGNACDPPSGIQRLLNQPSERGAAETGIGLVQRQSDQGGATVQRTHGDVVKAGRTGARRITQPKGFQRGPAIRGDLHAAFQVRRGAAAKQRDVMAGACGSQRGGETGDPPTADC